LARLYPNDKATALITRAAVAPATMTTSGWADTLAQTALADFIETMGGASSELYRYGMQLQFDGDAAIKVPGLLSAATDTGFVGEGLPIPVRKFSFDGPTLVPKKFATITTFTRELFQHSTPTAEAIVRATLTQSVSLAQDMAMLDATAGSASRPAGLR